ERESGPAEESAVGEGDAARRKHGGFLRVVGLGGNRAQRAGAPRDDGARVAGRRVGAEAGERGAAGDEAERDEGEGGSGARARQPAISAKDQQAAGGGGEQ